MSMALRTARVFAAGLLLMCVGASVASAAAPEIGETLDRAKAAWAKIEDYTCALHRQERHGDRLYRQRGIQIKFRKPYAVYMKWTEDGMAGTEALYVRGKNGGRMLAHTGGFLGFVTLRMEPRDPRAMKENRHPIDESSLGDLLDMLVRTWEQSRKAGDGKWLYGGEDALGDRTTDIFSVQLPAGKGYYAKALIVNFDRATGLPIRVSAYGWDGLPMEEYWYDALRLNVGLTDRDFDPANREYRF